MLKVYVKPILEETTIEQEEILFRELQSEALTGQDIIDCVAPIIDQPGWEILDKITAKGRGVQKMSMTHDKVKTRSEKMAFLTNGRNSLQLYDWKETTSIVKHDPIIRMIGPDAQALADTFLGGMLRRLVDRLVTITLKEDVATDIANLTGEDLETIKAIEEDLVAEKEVLIHNLLKLDQI